MIKISFKDKINILYVHGYGSNGNSKTATTLRENIDDNRFNVFSPSFSNNPDVAKNQISESIKKLNIDLVIGSSLGGFMTLLEGSSIYKIVINPTLKPSESLPKIGVDVSISSLYEKYENIFTDMEDSQTTIGLFSTDDELIDYRKEFNEKYYNSIITMTGGHRITEDNIITKLIPLIENWYVKKESSVLNEQQLLNEKYLTALTNTDMDKYGDEVWDILVKSYAPIGGLAGMENLEQLKKESNLWKMVKRDNKIVAVKIYTTKRGGRKSMYSGTDGTITGKKALFDIIKEDIKLNDRLVWVEASGAMEHIYKKFGMTPIPNSVVHEIIPDKKIISLNSDGYHYTRKIGDGVHEKMMFGNIFKIKDDRIEFLHKNN